LRESFLHFLVHHCQLHPQVRGRVADSGKVPALLSYRFYEHGPWAITLRLRSVSRSPDAWTGLPAGFTRKADPRDPLAPVEEQFQRAVREARAPTKEDVTRRARESLRGGDALDAYLTSHEFFLQTGLLSRDLQSRIRQAADEEVRALLAALGGSDVRRLVEAAAALERRKPAKGYVLGVIRANALVKAGRTGEARELFQKALEANPYLAAVYHDLGNLYYRDFAMIWAWRCFEMARTLAPAHPVLRPVDQLQARLEKDFPEDFARARPSDDPRDWPGRAP
jgi:tetratricopeptide (TPR) repeat protein